MTFDLPLRCRCGAVTGTARGVSAETGNHIICYCDDCRAFIRHLERMDTVDSSGGSQILQMTPAQLDIRTGQEQLRCVRLSARGLMRWYTACCNTPVANTLSHARVPFAGVSGAFIDPAVEPAERARAVGPVRLRGFPRLATGPVEQPAYDRLPPAFIVRTLWLLGRSALTGKHQPSPFFARGAKTPRVTPKVLSKAERSAASDPR